MQTSKTIKLKDIGFIELLSASYLEQSFNKHFHEEFCFGVVESGQLDFNYRGKKVHAFRGMINLCNPGEVHDGFTKQGWSYKMFYVDSKLMQSISSELSGKNNDIPFFKEGIIEDEILSKDLLLLHTTMSDDRVFNIEKEEMFVNVITSFIKKHADSFIPIKKLITSKPSIHKTLEYINDNLSEEILVSDLSKMANFSLYYFIRVFKQEIGLTPKEYVIQQRIRKAKELIALTLPLSQIAQECGFYDQSHMIKYFKAYTGLNPSIYQ